MTDRDIMQQALDALRQCEFTTPPAQRQIVKNALAALNERLARPEQEPNKDGSLCPEFWDWLPKAYNFDGNGAFTKYNMEVAFLAGKQTSQPAQQEPVAWGCNRYIEDDNGFQIGTDEPELAWGKYAPDDNGWWPLYTSPQPAQQEPVAVVSGYYGGQCVILPIDPARIFNSNTPLYTAPQPCPTCEALARTVMLDQTSHDNQRKPTDEMVVAAARVLSDRQAAACNVDCGDMWKLHGNDFIDDARAALESAHGIREKNT
jgi:hypothetical protein